MKHEYHAPCPHALSDRRLRRRMGLGRPLFDPAGRSRAAAAVPTARSLQRPALDRARGGALAPAAHQFPALANRLPADPSLAGCGLLRGAGARPAPAAAAGRRPGGAALGSHSGRAGAAVESRERRAGGLRRAQATQGLQGPCGGGHAGPARGADGDAGQSRRAHASRRAGGADPSGDRRPHRVGLGGSRLHRRGGRADGGRPRHPTRSRQAPRGQAGLCALAAPLGGRAQLCLGRPLPPPGARLRAAADRPGGPALYRLCLSLAPPRHSVDLKSITGSRRGNQFRIA
jgi:hypothetical protein